MKSLEELQEELKTVPPAPDIAELTAEIMRKLAVADAHQSVHGSCVELTFETSEEQESFLRMLEKFHVLLADPQKVEAVKLARTTSLDSLQQYHRMLKALGPSERRVFQQWDRERVEKGRSRG